MTQAEEDYFKKRYPHLFKDMDGDPYRTCMGRGIECGDGWFDILDKLCAAITSIDKKAYFSQIKEKYGILTIYMDDASDATEALVGLAEQQSEKTCEICGNPGILYTKGWCMVRCDEHKKD